ncbi:SPOR domain-containing protein [Chelatococcus sp. GCM10030263]|uniref:SPOR domain-containing protein n=1 Tax=Chelatococcus sp. GCM10030263 TaxID=3273387 RepID=UPI0036121A35
MIDRNKARFARDFPFEGNEPRFSSTGNTQLPGGDDPLAELARIVGQDDPFRGLLADDRRAPPDDGPIAAYGGRPAQPLPPRAGPPLRAVHSNPQDSGFDDNPLLRGSLPAGGSNENGGFQHPAVADPDLHPADGQYGPRGAYAYDDGYGQRDDDYHPDDGYASDNYDETANYEDTALPERRSRKGLIAVALILCMAAVGVASALVFRGGTGASGDGPPLITADNQPVKVEPQNPGGVDVPAQNNAIYDHIGDPVAATTKIVSREEQPLDVNQALRQEASSAPAAADTTQATGAIGPAGGPDQSVASIAPPVISDQTAPAVLPPGAGSPTDILGEPRRVKTVSVRPDGSIISDAPTPTPEPAPVMPADPTPANATPPAAQVAANEPLAEAPHVAPPAPARPSTRAPLRITPPAQRVASAAPIAPTPAGPIEVPPARQTNAAPTSTSGNFAVQLAAPSSEKDARELFSSLQRRYADLSGYKPFIRKAEVNDRTIYRLRIGPFSREDATSLCTRLQASGGQCFVARN